MGSLMVWGTNPFSWLNHCLFSWFLGHLRSSAGIRGGDCSNDSARNLTLPLPISKMDSSLQQDTTHPPRRTCAYAACVLDAPLAAPTLTERRRRMHWLPS